MIEAKSNDGNLSLACRGNLTDLIADLYLIVHEIWNQMPGDSKNEFERMFRSDLNLIFMKEDELDATVSKKLKGVLEMLEKETGHEN